MSGRASIGRGPMPEMFDSNLLRTFVTVARSRSFGQSAKLLALSQSAVSLQIRRLEETLGTTLLLRNKRGVQLTADGEAFIVHAERILALHRQAWESIRGGTTAPTVRIGLPDVYAELYLPGVLERFAEEFPGAIPQVHCTVSAQLVELFEQGQLDIALFIRHGPERVGTSLGRERLVWVCADGLQLHDDQPVPLAVYPEYCVFRAHGMRALANAGRSHRIVYTTQSTRAIDMAIDQGWAVAIKAERTAAPHWRRLGTADGLPDLDPVEVELRRSTVNEEPAISRLAELLLGAVRADLPHP